MCWPGTCAEHRVCFRTSGWNGRGDWRWSRGRCGNVTCIRTLSSWGSPRARFSACAPGRGSRRGESSVRTQMDKPKTVDVFMGTRPEGIKMAPVVAALKRHSGLRCRVVCTGQHREMFHQVAAELGFSVDVDLDTMQPNQTLAGLTSRLMQKIDGWLEGNLPDIAVVQGDTTTVFVAALACFYRGIPVGHVEAGLRTPSILTP